MVEQHTPGVFRGKKLGVVKIFFRSACNNNFLHHPYFKFLQYPDSLPCFGRLNPSLQANNSITDNRLVKPRLEEGWIFGEYTLITIYHSVLSRVILIFYALQSLHCS